MACQRRTGLDHFGHACDGARVIRLQGRRIKQNPSAAKRRRWQSQIGILPAVDSFAINGISRPMIRSKTRKNHPEWGGSRFGADYGARTRHLDLGKVALYQMS